MTQVFRLTMQFYFLFVLLFSFVMRAWNRCCDWSGVTFCAQFQFFVWGWSLAAQGQNEAIQHLRQVAAHPLPIATIMGMRDHRHRSDCAHHSSSSAFSNDADDASSLGFLPPAALWESNNLLDWIKGVGGFIWVWSLLWSVVIKGAPLSWDSNLKTLFYKDCSLGSVKTCLVSGRKWTLH